MNFYKRHLGDYAKDTGHLSMLEHGAYTLLLDRYYATEQPICKADAYRFCRARSNVEREAVDAVLREFFLSDGDSFLNRRAGEEIAKASHQREVNRELGKRGGRPKQTESVPETQTERITESVPENNPSQTPDSRHQKEKEKSMLAHAPVPTLSDQPAPPPCPQQEILALWAEILPAMPQHSPHLWRGAREGHLRARWRETSVEKHWEGKGDGLTFFRRLFVYIGKSAFLTGRAAPTKPGQRPFVIELEWLVNPSNWAKVIEGKYHVEQIAA